MECNINKAGYMATEVACGWAGAVMKKANSSIWAGAVMQKMPENTKKANGDRRTDGPTDIARYSCVHATKKNDNYGHKKIAHRFLLP